MHVHFWRLAKPGVDDFHTGIAQSARNHLGPAIVPVQAWLGHQHANFLLGHREVLEHRASTWATATAVTISAARSLYLQALPQIPAGHTTIGLPGFGDFFHLLGFGQHHGGLLCRLFAPWLYASPFFEIVFVHRHANPE